MKLFYILFFLSSLSLADTDLHLIYVNGVAEKKVEPNMALVQLESWAKAATAKTAMDQQALQFAKLKSSLEKFKIKKEDIQTQGFTVNPEYTYDQKAQLNKITAYRVSHSLAVIYRKTDDLGTLIDSLVANKGDSSGISVQSVSWDYDKKAEVESATLGEIYGFSVGSNRAINRSN
jgi:uncharacterized protein